MAADFESFARTVRAAYLAALAGRLPPSAKEAALWADPSRVVWVGLGHEQESFYLSVSFGMLREADGFVRQNLGTTRFDYLEQDKVRDRALADAYDDLLNPGLEVDTGALDADELHEVKEELRHLATLTALGLTALELAEDPTLLPMSAAAELLVTVADDRETPTWQAKLSSLTSEDAELRQAALDALCTTAASKTLLRALLAAADHGERQELLPALVEARKAAVRKK